MKTAAILGAIILVLAVMTLPRMPWMRAWKTRRTEKRILGWTGPMPAHDGCSFLLGEREQFWMIIEAEYPPDEKSYRWIGAALKAGQKARKA